MFRYFISYRYGGGGEDGWGWIIAEFDEPITGGRSMQKAIERIKEVNRRQGTDVGTVVPISFQELLPPPSEPIKQDA